MGFFAKLLGITPTKQPFHIDDTNFQAEVLGSSIPVLLDVWGPACPACKKLEPIVMQLAAEYDGRVKVCEVSTITAPRALAKLNVRGTPTVIYFSPRGRERERVVGMRGSLYHEETIAELFDIPKDPNAKVPTEGKGPRTDGGA